MDSFYGYETALWYWRLTAPRKSQPRRISRTLEPGSYVHTDMQEREQRPNWLDPLAIEVAGGSVHPMVFHQNSRSGQKECDWHVWESFPRDALVPAGEKSFVVSPECCFLQMAQRLDFHHLVLLGMELCGFYCIDPTAEEGFARREVALTSCERIRDFLAENEGARGRRAAETALRYVADGAASPMESAIYLLLCLPYKRGGYGLPRPMLNYPLELTENALKISKGLPCWGDICWPTPKLDLEYLGESGHEGKGNMLSDRRRTLAIEEAGYEVIEITKEQATDLATFDIIARRVAAKLGKRLDKAKCGLTPERRALAEVVFEYHAYETGQPVEANIAEDEDGPVIGKRA